MLKSVFSVSYYEFYDPYVIMNPNGTLHEPFQWLICFVSIRFLITAIIYLLICLGIIGPAFHFHPGTKCQTINAHG